MAISIPAKSEIRHVATAREYSQKQTFINSGARAGSYLSQATTLVYDDILRAQNSKPKIDIINDLTPAQKKAVYHGIKTIYQPLYGVSGSQYYDETYFNLLKGYVGSFFYKEYNWFNTNDQLNIFEFAALNLGNALYQFIDVVTTSETINEGYTDYAEQAMGVYNAYVSGGTAFVVREELKNKRVRIQLYDVDASGNSSEGEIVHAGFDIVGSLVVWDNDSYLSLGTEADISRFDYDFFAGNVLWFMDELVGIESDWTKDASPGIVNNTAYGYVQFTEDSVATAVTRYLEHIKRFNARKDIRDWQPWGVPKGYDMQIPLWLTKLSVAVDRQPNGKPGPGYDHEYELDRLTYDQTLALAFVHTHGGGARDRNYIKLSIGDVDAAKEIYTRNHHTNPDQATLDRLNTTIQTGRDKSGTIIAGTVPGFFRIHYVPAPTIKSFAASLPLAQSLNLLYNIISEQIFTDKYKENRDAVKAANGAP